MCFLSRAPRPAHPGACVPDTGHGCSAASPARHWGLGGRSGFTARPPRWLTNLDNQFARAIGTGGLNFFRRVPDNQLWAPSSWRTWPHLTCAADCGSDGLTAQFAMEYGWGFNLDRLPDQAHSCNNDFHGALQDSQLFGYMLSMMISWNLPYGPDKDHHRMSELREAMQQSFKRSTAKTSPLFVKMSGGIVECMERNGLEFHTDDKEEEAWVMLQGQQFGRKSGYRVNLCRFCGSLAKGLSETSWWEVDLYQRTYLALETDMLGNSALLRKIRLKVGASQSVNEGGGTTSASRLTMEDRGELRSCMSNAEPLVRPPRSLASPHSAGILAGTSLTRAQNHRPFRPPSFDLLV